MEQDSGSCSMSGEARGFCCPITGFCLCANKPFIMIALVMAIWVNLFSWLWHGSVMSAAYQSTATLWRGPTEMKIGFLNGGLTLLAIVAAYIFMKGYESSGWREGLRFGIIITLLFTGLGCVTYATQPIPAQIIQMWCVGDLIMYSVGGILMSAILSKIGKR